MQLIRSLMAPPSLALARRPTPVAPRLPHTVAGKSSSCPTLVWGARHVAKSRTGGATALRTAASVALSSAEEAQAWIAAWRAKTAPGSSPLQQWAHFAVALSAFLAADRALVAFAAANSISIPAPLLGMFLLIALLSAAEAALGTPAVDAAAAAAAPAVDWIGRWLPLFYVPSLVVLPLALSSLPGSLLAKLLALLIVGWAATLVVAALTTVQIRKVTRVDLLPAPPARKAAAFTAVHRTAWAALAAGSLLAAAAAPPQAAQLAGHLFMLSATVSGFLAGSAAPGAVQRVIHPLIACAMAANAGAAVLGAVTGAGWQGVLSAYLTKGFAGASWGAGDVLMAFLHSVILSFGFRVFSQRQLLKRHFAEIAGCVVTASLFSMLATAGAGAAMGLPPSLSLALAPRSVTVALALPIAGLLGSGSDACVTAAAVVLTGLLGANFAQPLLTALGFRDPLVRGLATAASAHGLGTAALAAKEPEALPVAALAYATTGIVSSLLVSAPQFRALLSAVAGG